MRFTNGGIRAILVSCIIISFVASPVSGCAEIFTWTRTSNTQFDSNIKIINAGEDLYATNGEEMMQYNNDEWKRIDTSVHPEVRMHFSISYDQKNEQILLFGGWDDSSESVFNDLWSFDVKTKIWS